MAGEGARSAQRQYYLAARELAVSGSLRLDGEPVAVSSHANWITVVERDPARGARGWDWIGINLGDSGGLMAFRMRDHEGRALWATATTTHARGSVPHPPATEVRFEPAPLALAAHWNQVPGGWAVTVLNGATGCGPLMDDSKLDSLHQGDLLGGARCACTGGGCRGGPRARAQPTWR